MCERGSHALYLRLFDPDLSLLLFNKREGRKRITLRYGIQWLVDDKKVEATPEEIKVVEDWLKADSPIP